MAEHEHFHPLGRPASAATRAARDAARTMLAFEDTRDFEESSRGFVAAPSYSQILADDGRVVWDMGSYGFLLEGEGAKGDAANLTISGLQTSLDKEKTISSEALAKVELLNQQIAAMRRPAAVDPVNVTLSTPG